MTAPGSIAGCAVRTSVPGGAPGAGASTLGSARQLARAITARSITHTQRVARNGGGLLLFVRVVGFEPTSRPLSLGSSSWPTPEAGTTIRGCDLRGDRRGRYIPLRVRSPQHHSPSPAHVLLVLRRPEAPSHDMSYASRLGFEPRSPGATGCAIRLHYQDDPHSVMRTRVSPYEGDSSSLTLWMMWEVEPTARSILDHARAPPGSPIEPPPGIEPGTCRLQGGRSTKLSYRGMSLSMCLTSRVRTRTTASPSLGEREAGTGRGTTTCTVHEPHRGIEPR